MDVARYLPRWMIARAWYGPLVFCTLILGGMTTGCGGGESGTTQPAPARPSAETTQPASEISAPVTKKQGIAFANAVNLHQGDVSALAELPNSPVRIRRRVQKRLSRCAGTAHPSRHLVSLRASPFFSAVGSGGPSLQVRSAVTVWKRAEFARAQSVLFTRRGRACLARLLPRLAYIPVDTPATVSFVAAPLPKIGATETRLRILAGPKRVPVYVDVINFLCGAAEIELLVISSPRAARPRFERHLLSLLYRRAHASDFVARTSLSSPQCSSEDTRRTSTDLKSAGARSGDADSGKGYAGRSRSSKGEHHLTPRSESHDGKADSQPTGPPPIPTGRWDAKGTVLSSENLANQHTGDILERPWGFVTVCKLGRCRTIFVRGTLYGISKTALVPHHGYYTAAFPPVAVPCLGPGGRTPGRPGRLYDTYRLSWSADGRRLHAMEHQVGAGRCGPVSRQTVRWTARRVRQNQTGALEQ